MIRELILAGALLLPGTTATAQQVRGRVLDGASQKPITGANVRAVSRDSILRAMAQSDSTGAFVIDIFPNDSVRLRFDRMGYAAIQSLPIALPAGDTLVLQITMKPAPVPLEEIAARAGAVDPELAAFMTRSRNSFGRYLGPAEIAQLRAKQASDILLRADPEHLMPHGRGIIGKTPPTTLRGTTHCTPTIWVDGLLVQETVEAKGNQLASAVPIDWYVQAQTVRAVEIYSNPSQAPSQFRRPGTLAPGRAGSTAQACTIAVIWTEDTFGR